MDFEFIYEAGRSVALRGDTPFPNEHFKGDSYWYYDLGYREIIECGYNKI